MSKCIVCGTEPLYRVNRLFANGDRKLIKRSVCLEEAQAHCRDPETSSRTCTDEVAKALTEAHGPWFDSYEEDDDL